MSDARMIRALPAALLLGSLAACGQKGPLYLPEQAREVVTRPAPAPAQPAESPAPDADKDKDKKQPDGTAPR